MAFEDNSSAKSLVKKDVSLYILFEGKFQMQYGGSE